MSEQRHMMDAYEYYQKLTQPVGQLPLMGPHMTEMQGSVAVERAVQNSPPPMDDVGEDVTHMRDPADSLLEERHKTHGAFSDNAYYGQVLRTIFRDSPCWKSASGRQREALDYIAGKLSRILSGCPYYADHWDDIAGYAKLAGHPEIP